MIKKLLSLLKKKENYDNALEEGEAYIVEYDTYVGTQRKTAIVTSIKGENVRMSLFLREGLTNLEMDKGLMEECNFKVLKRINVYEVA